MKKVSLLLFLLVSAVAMAQRLPETVVPVHYRLTFEPEFSSDSFRGEATIEINVLKPAASITMHAVELNIDQASISTAGHSQRARITADRAKQTITLSVPQSIAAGPAQVSIRYTARLSSDLRGFYAGTAGGRKYAATDFEPSDARRMFPSFDEPAMKATFDITAVIPKEDAAISNGPILSDTAGPEEAKHTVRFATSPKMSTYLVALIVGNFECTEGHADGVPIGICATPDKKKLAEFALQAARESLKYFNRYFAIRYPFRKLDLIALPDFAAGAMENTGAITFRESLLLVDAEKAPVETRKMAANVIAHEIAHQWFGDLVTMNWWDDIWLNEGFATWMENKPLAEWKPEWNVQMDEVLELGSSLEQDSRAATRPIRVPAREAQTPAQVENLFDGIAYGKAATVLRMLESYVGEEAFRAGVNAYVNEHAYGNAKATDFWSTVARVTGKPVDEIMPTFVDQAGAPMVSVKTACEGEKTRVTLSQQRFFIDRELLNRKSGEQWRVPVCMKTEDGKSAGCRVLTDPRESFTIEGCHPFMFANAGARGYYVTNYDVGSAEKIAKGLEALTPPEQAILANNEWALVSAAQHQIPTYLEMAESFQRNRNAAVWNEITGNLDFIGETLLENGSELEIFRGWVRGLLRPLADSLGWTPKADENASMRQLRGLVMRTLGRVGGDAEVLQHASRLAHEYLQDRSKLDVSLAGTVLSLAARQGDGNLYDRFLQEMRQARTPDEYQRWLVALSSFRDSALLRRTLELTLTSDVRGQDVMRVISRVLFNPAGRETAWEFLRARWEELKKKVPTSNLVYFAGMGSAFCDAEHARQFKDFFTEERIPGVQRRVRLSLEAIHNCTEMRRTQTPGLKAWLREQKMAARNQYPSP